MGRRASITWASLSVRASIPAVASATPGSARGYGHPELNVEERLVDCLIEQLEALREGAGKDMRLICDLNFNYKTEGFKRMAKAVERFNMMWLEMDTFDPKGLAQIGRAHV